MKSILLKPGESKLWTFGARHEWVKTKSQKLGHVLSSSGTGKIFGGPKGVNDKWESIKRMNRKQNYQENIINEKL